jgi:hypothetical protein
MDNKEVESLVNKIVAFNHAWKLAQKRYGEESPLTLSLRDQKACLQAEFLRADFGGYLVIDDDTPSSEALYSVRIQSTASSQHNDNTFQHDAAHMPVRIAKKLFTDQELIKLVRD